MKNRFDKLISSIVFLSVLVFSSCNISFDFNERNDKLSPSITLDWDELIIQDAEKNKTTRELVATVKNTDSRIIWFSSDKKVAEVTNDYSGKTTITIKGSGTAVIGAGTEDGSCNAFCNISVTLSKARCADFTNVDVKSGNELLYISWDYEFEDLIKEVKLNLYKDGTLKDTFTVDGSTKEHIFNDLTNNNAYSIKLHALDEDNFENEEITVVGVPKLPMISDLRASLIENHTGSILLTWNPTNSYGDFSYKITISSTEDSVEKYIDFGSKEYEIDGLTNGSYSVKMDILENSNVISSSQIDDVAVKKYIWSFYHAGDGYVLPVSENSVECSGESTSSSSYSSNFIAVKPFATKDSLYFAESNIFSLEATDISGNGTGKYLYFDGGSGSAKLASREYIEANNYAAFASFYKSDWANNHTPSVPEGYDVCNVRLVQDAYHFKSLGKNTAIVLDNNTGTRGVGNYLFGVKVTEE